MSDHNTTPAFSKPLTPDEQCQHYFQQVQELQRQLGDEQARSDRLQTACEGLGNALERQRRIEDLSPAARNLEQRSIDEAYKQAAAILQEARR